MSEPKGEVTRILSRLSGGDGQAVDELLPIVYEELRRIARSHMRRERTGHTLQATALTHEAFLRLMGGQSIGWQDRAHFLAVAARGMRRILVEHARSRGRRKRGGGYRRVPLDRIEAIEGVSRLTCWRWIERWTSSPPPTTARRRWSSCSTTEGLRPLRRRRSSA